MQPDLTQLELAKDLNTMRIERWVKEVNTFLEDEANWIRPQAGQAPHPECVHRIKTSAARDSTIVLNRTNDIVQAPNTREWMVYEHLSVQLSLPGSYTQGVINQIRPEVLQLLDPIVRLVWPVAGHNGERGLAVTIKAGTPVPLKVGKQVVVRTPLTAHFFRDKGIEHWTEEEDIVVQKDKRPEIKGRMLNPEDPVTEWVNHPQTAMLWWQPKRSGANPGLAALVFRRATGDYAVAVFLPGRNIRRYFKGGCLDIQEGRHLAESFVAKIIDSGGVSSRRKQ